MANLVATIVAVCVLAFYLILTTVLSVYWCIQRRKQKQSHASLEAQAESSREGAAYQRIVDEQQEGPSMYSETKSFSFLEGRGRVLQGSDRNSTISHIDRRYSSVNSLLIPLQPVHSVEEEVADDKISVKTGRSRASSTNTLRYYALASQDEQPLPAIPPVVSAPS
jgi:hypothetical protein